MSAFFGIKSATSWMSVGAGITLLCACGGTVQTQSGASSTGAGGATSSASSSTASSSVVASSSSTGVGGGACESVFVSFAVDGNPVDLKSGCAGDWAMTYSPLPAAYRMAGGPAPGTDALHLVACATSNMNSEGFVLVLDEAIQPGTYTKGSISYVDMNGSAWGVPPDTFTANITTYGMVDEYVVGDFHGVVSHGGNAAHNVDAKFQLCHVEDELVP